MKKFLIIDSYPEESREQFARTGMRLAAQLYIDMLLKYVPTATYDVLFSSDPGVELPGETDLRQYAGVLWPGCNLTVYHDHDARVVKILELVKRAYRVGVPQFGTCWGAQIAVVAAGGKVAANPKGREMGLGRKIFLTDEGRRHPMYIGKPLVFDGFSSHDDHVVELPPGCQCLASNEFSQVQSVSVEYEKGVFWALQYHPEYDLHEVARLIVTREERLIKHGFFKDHDDLVQYVDRLEAIHDNPKLKHLCWQLGIDEHVLDDSIRQREFINWLEKLVLVRTERPV